MHFPVFYKPSNFGGMGQRELIQQGTPMVGFQRGMDFLTNFPDFLSDMAGQEATPSSAGTAAAPVPPASLPHQAVALDSRGPWEAPGTGSHAASGAAAGSSERGSSQSHAGPLGPRRVSLGRAAIVLAIVLACLLSC